MKFFTFKWKNRQEQKSCSTLKHAHDYAKIQTQHYGEKNPPEIIEQQTEFSVNSWTNLQDLLDEIKAAGITDFSKIEFETNRKNCYYESDESEMNAVYKI